MKYSVAFAAAFAMAQAGMIPEIQLNAAITAGMPVSSAAAAVEGTSTAWVTDEITILSCGPEVTNCPARSKTVVPTIVPVTSAVPVVTSAASVPPVSTAPLATSVPTMAVSSVPAVSAPASSAVVPPVVSSAPAPAVSSAAPPAPLLSTEAITTCVPTTIYKTVTVASAAQTAPYATGGSVGGSSYPSGAASGSGIGPQPTSSPIASSNGAAGLSASFGGMALAAVAAMLFA